MGISCDASIPILFAYEDGKPATARLAEDPPQQYQPRRTILKHAPFTFLHLLPINIKVGNI